MLCQLLLLRMKALSLSLPVPRPDTTPPPPPAINTPLTSEVWSIWILTIIFKMLELSWTHWILFDKIYLEIIFIFIILLFLKQTNKTVGRERSIKYISIHLTHLKLKLLLSLFEVSVPSKIVLSCHLVAALITEQSRVT